jgi:hypothetical protein
LPLKLAARITSATSGLLGPLRRSPTRRGADSHIPGLVTPQDSAEWILRVIEDDTRAGSVLQLTKAEGGTYR